MQIRLSTYRASFLKSPESTPSATVRRLQSSHSERRERTSAEAPGSLTLCADHASRSPPTIAGGKMHPAGMNNRSWFREM